MLDCNVCISPLRPVSPVRLALLDGNQRVSGIWMELVIELPVESLWSCSYNWVMGLSLLGF